MLEINLNCLSSYSGIIQILVGFLSLTISFLTFRLAKKIQKEFLKNHTKTKQVEMMSELLVFLNQTKISITFASVSKSSGHGTRVDLFYNIFEIGNLLVKENANKLELDNGDFDDCQIYLDNSTMQIIEIKDYIDNAFIPKPIADKLLNFNILSTNIIDIDELLDQNENTRIVILSSNENQHNILGPYKQVNLSILISWFKFKKYSSELIEEITKWFKSNGISDLNLRIDYKNVKH